MSVNRSEAGIHRGLETAEAVDRAVVVSAFNNFYLYTHEQSIAHNSPESIATIKAGVEKAVGQVVGDPRQAIPNTYR